MILEAITGLLIGLLLAYIFDIAYRYLKRRRESPIIRRMRAIAENMRISSPQEGPPAELDIEALLLLIDNWSLDIEAIGREQALLLSQLGLAKIFGKIVVARKDALRLLVDGIRERRFEPNFQLVSLSEEILEGLGRMGVLSVSFFKIISEVGPRFLFATAKTKLMEKLNSDPETQNRIFLLAESLSEFQLDGSRIIFKELRGGERGLEGLIVVEITRSANVEDVIRFLSRISTLPRTPEEAAETIRDAIR